MDPISATVGGGLALLGGVSSATAANRQNNAIRRNIAEQYRVTQDAQNQNAQAAARERSQRLRAMNQAIGRARVAFAGADALPFVGMAAAEGASGIRAADQAFAYRSASINSQYLSNAYRLRDSRQSVAMAALQGALQGASTGIAIGQGISSLARPQVASPSPLPFMTGMPGVAVAANPVAGWGTP